MKKAISLLLTTLMVVGAPVFAFAAEPSMSVIQAAEGEGGLITVKGTVTSVDEVTILVVPKGAAEITESNIAYIDQDGDQIGQDGKFELKFYLKSGTAKGEYDVFMGGTGITAAPQKTTFSYSGALDNVKLGDVDQNTVINITDVTTLLRHVRNSAGNPFDDTQKKAADVDKNTIINITDVTTLLKHVRNPGANPLG